MIFFNIQNDIHEHFHQDNVYSKKLNELIGIFNNQIGQEIRIKIIKIMFKF